jgi:nitrite reductase/ring-hydroxylating ferredoxin subunit
MPAVPSERVLCRLDDLPDNSSRGFSLDGDPGMEIFIVRRAARVYAYRNSCPHTGAPLDWLPDQFLNAERTLIQCATHAAQFRIDDGVCIAGPCHGARLTALPVVVVDGVVLLMPDLGGV